MAHSNVTPRRSKWTHRVIWRDIRTGTAKTTYSTDGYAAQNLFSALKGESYVSGATLQYREVSTGCYLTMDSWLRK